MNLVVHLEVKFEWADDIQSQNSSILLQRRWRVKNNSLCDISSMKEKRCCRGCSMIALAGIGNELETLILSLHQLLSN
jgi:hypothetical protein